MEAQTGFETFIEATRYLFRGPSPQEILLLLIVLGSLVLIVTLPFFYSRLKEKQRIRENFFRRAKEFDLTEEEANVLWRYVKDTVLNPNLVFENKAVFEKVVDKIVENGNPREIKLISSIRMKLRFSSLPWFIPLTSTRDVEVYQTGILVVENRKVDAYVYDKDEEFLYIALLEPVVIKVGDRISFFFLRENDARYTFEATVEKVFSEGGRTVIAVRHASELKRIQLRESVRWKVKIPAEFTILRESGEEVSAEGQLEDISVKGARVCFEGKVDVKEGDRILLDFTLRDYTFKNLLGTIVHKIVYEKRTCLGVKFEELSRKEEKVIEQFILEEQRKLLKAYKEGEV